VFTVRRDPLAVSGPLTLGGVTLPRALFWIVIAYVLVATIFAFVIGRPLIRLSYMNELLNAGFRYSLVRLRDAGAAIGLYRGENAERAVLNRRLSAVMENYGYWRNRMVLFMGWNLLDGVRRSTRSRSSSKRPGFSPSRFRLATIFQSSTAFHNIHNSLSFLSKCVRLVRELSRGHHPSGRAGRREFACPRFHSSAGPRSRRRAGLRSAVSKYALPTASTSCIPSTSATRSG